MALLCALTVIGCGGGGSSPTTANPFAKPGNFSLTLQPAVVSLAPGASAKLTVGLRGSNLSGTVRVSVSGLPEGVTATPSQFSLASEAQQSISLTASSAAANTDTTVTVSGDSGLAGHRANARLLVSSAEAEVPLVSGGFGPPRFLGGITRIVHTPFRTSYVRTDTQWDNSFLSFAPQRWIIYNEPSRRFFAVSTFMNRVDVLDADSQQLIQRIPVPGAFVGDQTPDQSAIYMGTQTGDIYLIDPFNMKVVKRFPAVQIGPTGFAAFEVRVLADGRLAMLGAQGGIPAIDGFDTLAIWNPADNSFFIAPRTVTAGCPFTDHITEFTLTADRTRVLLGKGVTNGPLCSYDPVTDAQKVIFANAGGIGLGPILTPPDGKEIIIAGGSEVKIYDPVDFSVIDQFPVGQSRLFYDFLLSSDGNTIYASPSDSSAVLAYDWRTHQFKGWTPNLDFLDIGVVTHPDAISPNGLIAAEAAHGVGFIDAAALRPGAPGGVSNSFVAPSFGPVAGGTTVQMNYNTLTGVAASNVFFGNVPGTNVAQIAFPAGSSAVSPANQPGPLDITVQLSDGDLLLAPESFSYGPSIIDVVTDSTTADGGATLTIFGYGFGTARFGGLPAPGLQVSVNGTAITNPIYSPNPLDDFIIGPAYLFPMESLTLSAPPGTAGASGDIQVSNTSGSTTAAQALRYLPATHTFPLPGSVLVQGIYDSVRDVYYFSDATKVQVFSKTRRAWLTPINMPPGALRLWGLSLSPDGSKLAVSDAGADRIYVLNPNTPATISTFNASALSDPAGGEPAGLAVTDAGVVYYMMFYTQLTGPPGLHKLDTVSGANTPFQSISALALGNDALTRVLLSSDNSRLYVNVNGFLAELDTATDTLFNNPVIPGFDYELTLAGNQTWMSATGWLMDTNFNPESFLTFTDRQSLISEVFGAKLSPDGLLFFQPLTDGIDVFDGKQGILRTHIALPVNLSANYDALVADGKDNVLLGIAGLNGDGGVAIIDLSSLPLPSPLPFAPVETLLPKTTAPFKAQVTRTAKPAALNGPVQMPRPLRHLVTDPQGGADRMLP